MKKILLILAVFPIFLFGMDELAQRRIGSIKRPDYIHDDLRKNNCIQNTNTQEFPPRQINMIKLIGSAAIFVCGFSHLLYRIEAGTPAADQQLAGELVSTLFFVPMADEYGNLMEHAAGN